MAAGVDAVSSAYPLVLTQAGCVWTPDWGLLEGPEEGRKETKEEAKEEATYHAPGDGMKVQLRDKSLATDARPLNPHGCRCYTCTHHSRAYLNHLLNAHELLGEVLLYTCNLTQFLRLFELARKNIRAGTLPQLIERVRSLPLPSK
jgi:tRNA-guanine family transglycosylase